MNPEFPLWLSGLQTLLASMRTQVQSLVLLSRLRIRHCHELCVGRRHSSRSCIAVAVTQASSYSSGSTSILETSMCHEFGLKQKKDKKKKKKKLHEFSLPIIIENHNCTSLIIYSITPSLHWIFCNLIQISEKIFFFLQCHYRVSFLLNLQLSILSNSFLSFKINVY